MTPKGFPSVSYHFFFKINSKNSTSDFCRAMRDFHIVVGYLHISGVCIGLVRLPIFDQFSRAVFRVFRLLLLSLVSRLLELPPNRGRTERANPASPFSQPFRSNSAFSRIPVIRCQPDSFLFRRSFHGLYRNLLALIMLGFLWWLLGLFIPGLDQIIHVVLAALVIASAVRFQYARFCGVAFHALAGAVLLIYPGLLHSPMVSYL